VKNNARYQAIDLHKLISGRITCSAELRGRRLNGVYNKVLIRANCEDVI